MKKPKNKKARRVKAKRPEPTAFEQIAVIHSALQSEMGTVGPEISTEPEIELPEWAQRIIKQLGKTILKPILKLRPNGEVNWRNYGKMITVMERYKTFLIHDVPRILEEEFSDITDEQWEKIEPRLGLDKLRAELIKRLNRSVKDDEPLEALSDEVVEKTLETLESHKQNAFRHLAHQPPGIAALFFKGMAEGYSLFIDENARFSGDRGRATIHLNLLSSFIEVEIIRRTLPPTTRSQYYDTLATAFKMPPKQYDWFNDVCDDIKFPLNNLGRKRRGSAPIL